MEMGGRNPDLSRNKMRRFLKFRRAKKPRLGAEETK